MGNELNLSDIKNIDEIRKLLGFGGSFFINFEINERMDLREAIEAGYGFTLVRVYKHPNKQKPETFVLEIQANFPGNKDLQFNDLAYLFAINNHKKKSPNLTEFWTIEDFESIHKAHLGRPKTNKSGN